MHTPQSVWVKTVQNSACKDCSAHGACEAAKEGEVNAINSVGAKVGDRVVVGFPSGSFMRISLLLYIFPVCCLIVGAVIGNYLAPRYGMDESVMGVIFSLGFLLLAFLCIRLMNRRLSGNTRYQAQVVRIRRPRPEGEDGSDRQACSESGGTDAH